jgi:ribosomal protein S18 acetylase RimI-like enzyme
VEGKSLSVHPYVSADEQQWLRCRAIAFLDTNYFDDVVAHKPTYDSPSVELVAHVDDELAGLLDVAIYDDLATIETVATHPDHSRRGLAGELLSEALRQLPPSVTKIDAWTREDIAANGWYKRNGFHETFAYLHVYARTEEEITASAMATSKELTPVAAFFHARAEDELRLRQQYERVYRCRRYERSLWHEARARDAALSLTINRPREQLCIRGRA